MAPVVGVAVFSPLKPPPPLMPGLGLAVGAEDRGVDGAAEAFSPPEFPPSSVDDDDDGDDVGVMVAANGGGGVDPEADGGSVSFSS